MKKLLSLFTLLLVLCLLNSCGLLDDLISNNSLSGNTEIELTTVGNVSTIYGEFQGQVIKGASMTVKSRSSGIVVYEAIVDLTQFPDSLKLKAFTTISQLSSYYKFDTAFTITTDNKLKFEFKLKITEEGYMDYAVENKPWVIGKYADGVGTEYSIKNDKGETLTRKITEKTGLDDWPLGFILIKTSKIESITSPDDPVISKVIYRINHKFGLVYIEYQYRDGTSLKLDIFS